MKTFYIYKHIDPITLLPFYIGKGKNNRAHDFKNRFGKHKEHIEYLKSKNLEPIVDFIEKDLNDKNAKEKEVFYIKEYIANGILLLNGTFGGEGGDTSLNLIKHPKSKEVICVSTGELFLDVYKAAKKYNIDYKEIRLRCRDTREPKAASNGLVFKFKDKIYKIRKQKPHNWNVEVYSSSGNIYKNTKEASNQLNIDYSALNNHIRGLTIAIQLENEKLETFWLRGQRPKPIPSLKEWKGKKKIKCLNNNKIYNSSRQAAKDLNIDFRHIGCVCKGKRKHTKGYVFEYIL
jgi:hypothetical protein